MISPSAGTLDEAYERLHVTGPEFDGFLSNHGPMAAEAMVRHGQSGLVAPGSTGTCAGWRDDHRQAGPAAVEAGCRRRHTRKCPAVLTACLLRYRMDNGLVIEVDPERFEEMVAAALDELPEELGRLMSNVAVTVEHGAGPPGLLGLYEGIPLTSRTTGYAGVLPDRITIYRQAISAISRTEQEVASQVRQTVIHEIAHHFGIDDKRLRELGW